MLQGLAVAYSANSIGEIQLCAENPIEWNVLFARNGFIFKQAAYEGQFGINVVN
jgi:hypothetical protein